MKARIKELEEESRKVNEQFDAMILTAPQPAAPEVPVGPDESGNVELRKVGQVPTFGFTPKDHVALLADLGLLDVDRGVKLAGARNYVLKGDGVALHRAVMQLAVDLMNSRGYTQMFVPVLVRDAMMVGTGYFPGGEEQAYRCERDEMSLVGTAEVPLTAYHSDEILSEDELPKKYFAMSACFRREAGAAGKDTYGLYRIHYFEKVEQVIICRNDEKTSIEFHAEILKNSEDLLAALELPYRVVNVCTGDLGQGQVQKFDIETWMPSRKNYGETHSASRFYEYQARRLKPALSRPGQEYSLLPYVKQYGDRQPAGADRPGGEPPDRGRADPGTEGAAALPGRARGDRRIVLMERQLVSNLSERRRLERLAGRVLVDVRKANARAERLLHCLRGSGDMTGRDRVSPADDESGWRLAA